MNRKERLKIIGLTEEEVRKIKRKTYKETNPDKYTDAYLDMAEISVQNFNLCTTLIEQANKMKDDNQVKEAKNIVEKCILEYKTVQPEAYYLAAEIIDDKDILANIIQHYKNNEFLFEAKKLKEPILEIKAKYEHGLSLNELNLIHVQSFVQRNKGINKTKLLSGLIKEYEWHHHKAQLYISEAFNKGLIKQEKIGRTYSHFTNH